jgi:hypothetical protein
MKIRLDQKTYRAAQRIADTEGLTFNRWATGAISKWKNNYWWTVILPPVTRTDSVSVAIDMEGLAPLRMRQCIALAVQIENEKPWPWKYDRATLQAMQQVQMFFKKTCSYAQAQDLIDKRIAERTAELRVEQQTKRTKRHTGGKG